MSFNFARKLTAFKVADKGEHLKLILLSATFFLVIGAYTIIRDLRDSFFIAIVGREYIPWANLLEFVVLIPAVLFYSFLVDKVRRYQLLYIYSFFYSIVGFACAYLLGDPVIGLHNTQTSPVRLFGWFFYFFVEGFTPFVVSVFWAFANSINSPEAAKNNYGLMVAMSKIGGMLSAGLAWILLTPKFGGARFFSDVTNHQILLIFFSLLAFFVPFMIYMLIKKVPGKNLHGYEAVYQFEKQRSEESTESQQPMGVFSGLSMMIKWPYILGIFGMLFFYEMVNKVLSYQRLGVAHSSSNNISDLSCFLFQQSFFLHLSGFLISLIGTRALLKKLGEEKCLLLVPLSTGLLLLYCMLAYDWFSLSVVYTLFKSINYAFAQPVRESLYIPTVKEMKFKSKSWIDAFGAKLARATASGFNIFAELLGSAFFMSLHAVFFAVVVAIWTVTAILLGKRYSKAIANNEVIG